MPNNLDPTRTATLIRSVAQSFGRTIRTIRQDIPPALRAAQALPPPERIAQMDAFFEKSLARLVPPAALLDTPTPWRDLYYATAFATSRAVATTQRELRRASPKARRIIPPPPSGQPPRRRGIPQPAPVSLDAITFNTDPQAMLTHPAHIARRKLIKQETFSLVKSIGDRAKPRLRNALANSIQRGEGIPTIADKLSQTLKISQNDANRIARTEITKAHNLSLADEAERFTEAANEAVYIRWLTFRDELVRAYHRHRQGKLFTITAYRSRQRAPNCRCGGTTHPASSLRRGKTGKLPPINKSIGRP